MLWLPVSKHKRADYLLQKTETPMLIHLQDKNRIRHTLSINTDWRRATASCNKFYDSLANAHKKTRQDNHVVVTDQSKLKSACQSIQQETKSTIPMPSIRGFEPALQI